MKARIRLLSFASVAAIGGGLMVTAQPAAAAEVDMFCLQNSSGNITGCMASAGWKDNVDLKKTLYATTFTDINEKTEPNGEHYYEWQDENTGNCLEWNSGPNRVIEDTCTPGRASELWWNVNFQLINYYSGKCANSISINPTSEIDSAPCNGNDAQAWLYAS